jgi:Peptidase S24-like
VPSFAKFARNLLVLVALVSTLQATEGSRDWIRGIYTKGSPAPKRIPSSLTLSEAQALAAQTGGCSVITGRGNSMAPLYPDGTVLVVAQRPYDALERGMTVVYRNRANRSVAHVLVARANDGWRVTGLNNRNHDGEGVDASNLVGVVIAAFQPVPGIAVSQR